MGDYPNTLLAEQITGAHTKTQQLLNSREAAARLGFEILVYIFLGEKKAKKKKKKKREQQVLKNWLLIPDLV